MGMMDEAIKEGKVREDYKPFLTGRGSTVINVDSLQLGSRDGIEFLLLEGKVESAEGEGMHPIGTEVAYQIDPRRKFSYKHEIVELFTALFPGTKLDVAGTKAVLDGKIPVNGKKVRAKVEPAYKEGQPVLTKKGKPIFNVKISGLD